MFKQVLVLMIAAKICLAQQGTVLKNITDGTIKGLVETTRGNNLLVHSFIGVPYAEPPLGPLRFAAPVKKSPWSEIYDATFDRSPCMQSSTSGDIVGDENCLHISVKTPANASNLPVIVWFYGGGFQSGNCSFYLYGPDDFVEQGLVYVTFNYRLGVFGFLSTEDEACPGNWGLKDQILALNWVQNNVGFFGGDPTKVTIFGESAGAASVHLMMQTPQTKGLFRAAIMDSGSSANLWSLNTRASEYAASLAVSLGIIIPNNTFLIEQLRTVEARRLYLAATTTSSLIYLQNPFRGTPWGPVVELVAPKAVLTQPSCYALSQGNFNRVPVLMGTNTNEGANFGNVSVILKPFLIYYDVEKQNLTPYSMTKDIAKRLSAAWEIDNFFFNGQPIVISDQRFIEFMSVDQFDRGVRQAATLMSAWTLVYHYVFGFESKIPKSYKGVAHAEELRYLFTIQNEIKSDETDIKVSKMLVKLWSNFVKECNPTPTADPQLNNTIWQPLDPTASNFNYMSINESMVPAFNPKQGSWEFYKNLWAKYGDNTPASMTTY